MKTTPRIPIDVDKDSRVQAGMRQVNFRERERSLEQSVIPPRSTATFKYKHLLYKLCCVTQEEESQEGEPHVKAEQEVIRDAVKLLHEKPRWKM